MTNQKNRAGLSEEMEQDCILFQGKLTKDGYGQDTLNKKPINAHRKVWIELHGPIPSCHVVLHICRNKNCINPEHLIALPKHEANLMAFDLRQARRKLNIHPSVTATKQTKTNPVCNENMQHVADEMIAIMTGKKRRY